MLKDCLIRMFQVLNNMIISLFKFGVFQIENNTWSAVG